MKLRYAIYGCTMLIGCTSTQVTDTANAGKLACTDAMGAASLAQTQLKGGALATANGIIPYVQAACVGGNLLASLATDPTTLNWLGTLTGMLKATVKPAA
jgi:hypothetical protein